MGKEIYEIRRDVIDYIISEVNLTLSRLGVNGTLKEVKDPKSKLARLYYETEPIPHTPAMFRKLIVTATLLTPHMPENSIYYKASQAFDLISVDLDYRYESFDKGTNGSSIGTILFGISHNIPTVIDDCLGIDLYVRKIKGLEI